MIHWLTILLFSGNSEAVASEFNLEVNKSSVLHDVCHQNDIALLVGLRESIIIFVFTFI